MLSDIHIVDWSAVSSLGHEPGMVWSSYLERKHFLDLSEEWRGKVPGNVESALEALKHEHSRFRNIDRSTLLALLAGRKFSMSDKSCGLNIGSSRGATGQFETFYDDYLRYGNASPVTSPTTTLGNLSSWVAQDLGLRGFSMSHSITCSTALHSIANACAWIRAGFSGNFIAGGTEAPLTPFTIAQMKALRIYATPEAHLYPCRSYDLSKTKNSMVLGEGAALFYLGNSGKPLCTIRSIGFATEQIRHGSSISDEGHSLRDAMSMALQGIDKSEVDAVVLHAPGTLKGDHAEKHALTSVFGDSLPLLTGNKWKIGHTLGASGALSMEFALLMLQHQVFIGMPWEETFTRSLPLRNILVNAAGFGGNAVSVLLSRPV
jgi:3-oxoacyl-[acyl-carrier-protein] synthase II